MIPPDVASSLRQILPDQLSAVNAQTKPVIAAEKIADVLSNFVPGQRVLAEIQALLPNGTYRAIVAQREITLALPFSAKAGDSLELEVTETDGKLALAFIGPGKTDQPATGQKNDSVATVLSQTGKLIGSLQGDIAEPGKRAVAAALNGNQPLVETFPEQAATLAPVLKDALVKSGVFYEAHQARWVAGNLSTESLKQEPQGRLSPPPVPLFTPHTDSITQARSNNADLLQPVSISQPAEERVLPSSTATVHKPFEAKTEEYSRPVDIPAPSSSTTRTEQPGQANSIPRELVPIVQQQLDALATQNYAWQGQVWPGQQMHWEIDGNPDGQRSNTDEAGIRWQTRLNLELPSLGGIDAVLRLAANGDVKISMTANSESGEERLREYAGTLKDQMSTAGLNLTQLLIEHGEIAG